MGTPKAGTTSLYYSLIQHPEIFMSYVKEPNFFLAQSSKINRHSIKGIDWINKHDDYCELFRKGKGKKAIGEASVSYLYNHKIAVPGIKKYLGDPKIIIMLRDPVERTFSAYSHWVLENWENRSFEDAILAENVNTYKMPGFKDIFPYMKNGFYFDQVKTYMENFTHVGVFLFDDLKNDAVALSQSVYTFLGVDQQFIPDVNKYNITGIPKNKILLKSVTGLIAVAKRLQIPKKIINLNERRWQNLSAKMKAVLYSKLLVKPEMNPETASYLRDQYREDIHNLGKLIGRDLSNWMYKSSKK